MNTIKITQHNGKLLADGLNIEYHIDSLKRYLELMTNLRNGTVTPSQIIGKGYGSRGKVIATEWIQEGIDNAINSIEILVKEMK